MEKTRAILVFLLTLTSSVTVASVDISDASTGNVYSCELASAVAHDNCMQSAADLFAMQSVATILIGAGVALTGIGAGAAGFIIAVGEIEAGRQLVSNQGLCTVQQALDNVRCEQKEGEKQTNSSAGHTTPIFAGNVGITVGSFGVDGCVGNCEIPSGYVTITDLK